MTTIVTDGRTIAADGLAKTSWGRISTRTMKKIHVKAGVAYAIAGSAAMIDPVIAWHQSGCDPKSLPVCEHESGWTLLVVDASGPALYTSRAPYPDVLEVPCAVGSGGDYALGAILAGATPEEAVRIASLLDDGTGGEIQVVDIEEATVTRQKIAAAFEKAVITQPAHRQGDFVNGAPEPTSA